MEIGGVSPEGVAVPELGVAPLFDTDTELEDELPTPEVSLLFHDSSPQGVHLPEVCPAPQYIVDVEFEKAIHHNCVDTASYGDAARGAGGSVSSGSVYVSGASGSCSAV